MKRLLLVLAAAVVSSCSLNTNAPDEPSDPAHESFASSLGIDISTMTKTPGGAYYKDLNQGYGTPISGLPVVTISYLELLKTGAVVGQLVAVTQDLSVMVQGVQEGVQGMKPGSERLNVVPTALGYGHSQTVAALPPKSTLVFDLVFNNYLNQ